MLGERFETFWEVLLQESIETDTFHATFTASVHTKRVLDTEKMEYHFKKKVALMAHKKMAHM